MSPEQSAWVVIAKDPKNMSWGGHDGYDDEINEYYSYDSQVGNYKNVQVGDLVFVKGESHLLGFGEVEMITSTKATKDVYRCPKCGESPEARKRMTPRWRCSGKGCHYEFDDDEMLREKKEVIKFLASYKNTWRDANSPLDRKEVFQFQANQDNQSAIRPLDTARVADLIVRIMGSTALPIATISELPDVIVGGHVVQLTKRRVGQQEFRLALLENNGETCFISGNQPACVLEAAHIRKFSKYESHDLGGGILLRRDYHTLFDRYLIRINPDTWQTEVSPRIRNFDTYNAIHLEQISSAKKHRPDVDLLREHYDKAALLF